MELKSVVNIEICPQVVEEIRSTLLIIVESASLIHNAVRNIERNHANADDPALKCELHTLYSVAGDLSAQWQELIDTCAAYDCSDLARLRGLPL